MISSYYILKGIKQFQIFTHTFFTYSIRIPIYQLFFHIIISFYIGKNKRYIL